MKINSKFSEWENIIEGINRASVAHYVPQLSNLDVAGVAALVDRPDIFTSASEIAMRNLDMLSRPLDMMYMPDTQMSGIKTIVSQVGLIASVYNNDRMTEDLGNTLTMLSSLAEQVSMPVDRFSGIMAGPMSRFSAK